MKGITNLENAIITAANDCFQCQQIHLLFFYFVWTMVQNLNIFNLLSYVEETKHHILTFKKLKTPYLVLYLKN